jgi:hypothetical protein
MGEKIKRTFPTKTDFEEAVVAEAEKYGGIKNAHVHGDRAYTNEDRFYASTGERTDDFGKMTLPEKQGLTWRLHKGPAFEPASIEERARRLFDASIDFGVVEVRTTVDLTYNTGNRSIEVMEKLKREYAEKGLNILLGAYNTSGFKRTDFDNGSKRGRPEERYEIFEAGAKRCDFLMALAEKDRNEGPKDNGHIGEHAHNWYILELAHKLGKDVQFHVGQENRSTDRTLELLLDDIEKFRAWVLRRGPQEGDPKLTAVHAISTACLPDEEIDAVSQRMVEQGVSLITCPRAAISMVQDRTKQTPTHNSIAPLARMALKGVHIEGVGTDNVGDIYVPSGSPDLLDELAFLADGERVYGARILGKLLAGAKLDPYDISRIKGVKGF